MSMSKKIYAVMALLVIVAIGITGLATYSLYSIANVTEEVAALANRGTALNNMDKLILDRTIITREINLSTSEEEIAGLIAGRLLENEQAMQAYMKLYEDNLTDNSSDEAKALPRQIGDLWALFVSESKVVGELAMENTNNKASRINEQNVAFWEGVDKDLEELAAVIFSGTDKNASTYGQQVLDVRSDLLRFRLMLVKYIYEQNPEAAAEYKKSIGEVIQNVDSVITRLAAELPPSRGGDLAQKLIREKLEVNGKNIVTQIVALVDRNSNVLANTHMVGPTRRARIAVEQLTADFLQRISAAQLAAQQQSDEIERRSLIIMLSVSLAGIVIGSILAWRIISNVVSRLNKIIGGLNESSEKVFGSSNQISNASQALAEGATEQASSLEETSSALEQMASMTRQNADNAGKTSKTMEDTLALVTEGSKTVNHVTSAMAEISESAERIGHIIKTIEEIAFQTNLLALNAAVEAARAGEAGKGFAVVADEVRNLAQRSAQAAKDTSELIKSTVERVHVGSENVNNLAEGFESIDSASKNVGALVMEISAATNEQAQGVDQVNTAVAQMDKVTQTNAAGAEESASAALELSEQAEQLRSMVDDLVALVEGGKRTMTVSDDALSLGAPVYNLDHDKPTRAPQLLTMSH